MTTGRRQVARSLRTDAAAAMAVCPAWHARLAARRITQFFEARMSASGLSIAQFGLMAQIAAAEDDTLGALAVRMGLDQSTLSRNLKGLEEAGLIEIAVARDDQRRRMVWLTETGALRLQAALPHWRAAEEEIRGRVGGDVVRMLSDIAAQVSEE